MGRRDHLGKSSSPASSRSFTVLTTCFSMAGFNHVGGEVEERNPQEPSSEQPYLSHPLVYKKQAVAIPQ